MPQPKSHHQSSLSKFFFSPDFEQLLPKTLYFSAGGVERFRSFSGSISETACICSRSGWSSTSQWGEGHGRRGRAM